MFKVASLPTNATSYMLASTNNTEKWKARITTVHGDQTLTH